VSNKTETMSALLTFPIFVVVFSCTNISNKSYNNTEVSLQKYTVDKVTVKANVPKGAVFYIRNLGDEP
jgi:hypothetical protein